MFNPLLNRILIQPLHPLLLRPPRGYRVFNDPVKYYGGGYMHPHQPCRLDDQLQVIRDLPQISISSISSLFPILTWIKHNSPGSQHSTCPPPPAKVFPATAAHLQQALPQSPPRALRAAHTSDSAPPAQPQRQRTPSAVPSVRQRMEGALRETGGRPRAQLHVRVLTMGAMVAPGGGG